MQQLIKITENNGNRAVSARELYEFLEVETQFTKWCTRMFDYGFEENIDFILVKNDQNKVSKSNPIDYALTIDTAKEISMLQRTEKGKQARRYFIEMEKVATNQKEAPVIGNSIVENKKRELLEIIKANLRRGDITKIARELNSRNDRVKNALQGASTSKVVLEALYKTALDNKNTILFDYQTMIDMLKG
ncbi:antA/AntB antirepressor family protein [Flavobacterium covae]|uniref:antA/AntB antirepressor family protein n=1 Tax=Flavobacterium covae TaxID=2906076 RepID=UPI000745D7B4|nr:antA/AntB antirepressor family protein [Flavobacterium covae]AMA48091.1 hypothetical protein AWN65_00750 [Flavobacterium covae]MCJ1808890.1 antA/AntB antirepressor family protein [Flavobacterium covae]